MVRALGTPKKLNNKLYSCFVKLVKGFFNHKFIEIRFIYSISAHEE